ncbi:tetratricopeptide repeat protein, partial [Methanobacterium spitsbergense]
QDPDKTIQEEAITALGRIVVDPFIHDLKGEDRDIKDKAIIALNHIRELNVIEKNILPNEIKSSIQDNNQLDQDLKEEILNLKDDEQIIEKLVPTEISDMDAKKAELTKKGYQVYIENFIKNSRYNYIDGFIRKSRYDYEFTDIRNLRELLQYKGLEFSDEEMLSLIKEEIKNLDYLEFKKTVMGQKPIELTDYLEILIKDYPEPMDHIDQLKKLLNKHNIPHNNNLAEQIEKTQKQMEIKEFENKILANDTQNFVENASPSILKGFRMKELKENRDLMIANGKYIYIEAFVKKSRTNYELGNVQKFRELLTYKKMEFSLDDLIWLIQEEIKNQEYLEFREKLMIQKPETIGDYLEILIKIYPKPKDHITHLKKLLNEHNIQYHTNIAKQIEKTQKQMEIKEFENKILVKTVNEGILPVEMEDLDDAYICFNIGNLYYDLGKIENALTYYDKALYIYPDFIDAWKHMGLIYYTMGRLQKAAACYNQILNFDPNQPELWLDIGIIFFEIGKVPEAKTCYEKAMELNPCYKNEDFAVDTRSFLKNNINSLKKFDNYLELASSATWESSDPTPPLSRIMRLLD